MVSTADLSWTGQIVFPVGVVGACICAVAVWGVMAIWLLRNNSSKPMVIFLDINVICNS